MSAYIAAPAIVCLIAAYVWARREVARTRERAAIERHRRRVRRAARAGDMSWDAPSQRSVMRGDDDPELMTREMRTVWKPGNGKRPR